MRESPAPSTTSSSAMSQHGHCASLLSACCSARGDMNAADGVVGLQRAFLVAGSLSLVVSVFNVDDEATAKLMDTFYDRLFAGEDTSQALRSAMLQAIEGEGSDPSHWSTFVVVGRALCTPEQHPHFPPPDRPRFTNAVLLTIYARVYSLRDSQETRASLLCAVLAQLGYAQREDGMWAASGLLINRLIRV
eukprot:TRINITY_DN5756_c0_g1_i7.p1 TRINITY_DN5756_c0_g1~~TRINITY_DN5756_c0_g1_i7.p1  ORF type:complete len:191 (+),score=41.53 TRINITY_DN5756_c0_g1_i7:378-950(+)